MDQSSLFWRRLVITSRIVSLICCPQVSAKLAFLVFCDIVTTIVDEAFGVYDPDVTASFFLAHAIKGKEAKQLCGYPNAGGTSPIEENTMFTGLERRKACG